ncbi:MAG: hypothetical protein VYC64_07065 [Candidatus Latescibacterota bacterium]|nr:hypothetical protein [Candidatus Latescibacterota bacterium]
MPPQLPQNPPWRARSAGPQVRYICAEDLWRPVREPAGLDIVEPGPTIDPLYDLPFEHGLRDQGNTERPDMIAVVGRKDGQIVSLAAASAWTEAYVYVPRSERVAGDYLGLKRSRST